MPPSPAMMPNRTPTAAAPRATAPHQASEGRCCRESCHRKRETGRDFCSLICRAVVTELGSAEYRARKHTDNPEAGRLWAAAVAIADALAEYRTQSQALNRSLKGTK